MKARERPYAAASEVLRVHTGFAHGQGMEGEWSEIPFPSEASFPLDHNYFGQDAWRTANASGRGASQEQSEAAGAETLKANTAVCQLKQEVETSGHGPSPCKKRVSGVRDADENPRPKRCIEACSMQQAPDR